MKCFRLVRYEVFQEVFLLFSHARGVAEVVVACPPCMRRALRRNLLATLVDHWPAFLFALLRNGLFSLSTLTRGHSRHAARAVLSRDVTPSLAETVDPLDGAVFGAGFGAGLGALAGILFGNMAYKEQGYSVLAGEVMAVVAGALVALLFSLGSMQWLQRSVSRALRPAEGKDKAVLPSLTLPLSFWPLLATLTAAALWAGVAWAGESWWGWKLAGEGLSRALGGALTAVAGAACSRALAGGEGCIWATREEAGGGGLGPTAAGALGGAIGGALVGAVIGAIGGWFWFCTGAVALFGAFGGAVGGGRSGTWRPPVPPIETGKPLAGEPGIKQADS
jgi:hypothetical protein